MESRNAAGERVLLEVAKQFAATLQLSRLVPMVLDRVVTLLRAERALFALLDARGEIEHAVTHNLPWEGPPAPLPVSQSVLADVMRDRDVVIRTSTMFPDASITESMRSFGLQLIVCVPVTVRGALVGLLYVDSTATGGDEARMQTETLRAIGTLVGVAVDNARLFEELRYRRDLLAWMMHDLRNHMTITRANAEFILEDPEGSAVECATEVRSATDYATRMTDWALMLDRLEGDVSREQPKSVDVAALLDQCVRAHTSLARRRNISLRIVVEGELPTLESFEERLVVVLDNLLFNAVKFGRPNTVVTVRARLRRDAGVAPFAAQSARRGMTVFLRSSPMLPSDESGFVEVSVQNVGEAPSPELRERLFLRRARGEGPRSSHGLGLAIAYDCVRSLGGHIWLEPPADDVVVFAFTVPVRGVV